MAVADISRIRKRVIELLLASPRASRYGGTVGDNARYSVTQEVTDAALETDAEVCQDIISTPGHPYRSGFMAVSSNLSNGDFVPAHVGAHGEVDIDVSGGGTFRPSQLGKGRDEIQAILEFPSLYASKRFHWIEDSRIYHAGSAARVWTPSFTKTSACQAHEAYEGVVAFGTVERLEKDGGDPSFFQKYGRLYLLGRQFIRQKELVIPAQAELEKMLERRAA